MALTINTNIASLNAQRNLGKSQGALNKSMERLSSGLRINSAKDDAAGLAISNRMTTQIRGLNQAARNANDGISLAQTAEGALQESTNILQRMRELAVQSANDTNTAGDRTSMQAEVSQLIQEMNRIAETTSFNGKTLLDGTLSNATFQVGANAGQSISFAIEAASANDIGQIAYETTGTTGLDGTASTGDNMAINDVKIADSSTYAVGSSDSGESALALAKAINASGTGVRAEALATTVSQTAATTSATASLKINDVEVFDVSSALTTDQQIEAINEFSGQTGVVASTDGTDIILTADDGRNIQTVSTGTPFGASAVTTKTIGDVKLSSSEAFTLDATAASTLDISATVSTDDFTIASVSVASVSTSSDAIERIDAALGSIDAIRGGLGAIQNRFEYTIANLQNVSENLSAARSRILDADIAQETSSMTKNNILQQAGVSILAQANQAPQLALSLLQ